eukprot:Sspe_Gene.39446::Locus_19029_Transcript_1_1_Confidence_1.000_Length_2398::g.39446::m.39446
MGVYSSAGDVDGIEDVLHRAEKEGHPLTPKGLAQYISCCVTACKAAPEMLPLLTFKAEAMFQLLDSHQQCRYPRVYVYLFLLYSLSGDIRKAERLRDAMRSRGVVENHGTADALQKVYDAAETGMLPRMRGRQPTLPSKPRESALLTRDPPQRHES